MIGIAVSINTNIPALSVKRMKKSPWFISLFASKNAGVLGKMAIHEVII